VDELKQKREEARTAVERLRSASGDAVEDMRRGAEKAWERMADSLDSARKRFH
jgi:hypothetical protein